jgi:hypothetical protein
MTPFRRIAPNPLDLMRKREVLLAQPPEFFKDLCGGRVPNLQEKLHCVEMSVQRIGSLHRFENDVYAVDMSSKPPFIHLDISRHDAQPCTNWKDFQQIKNELVGPEYEAVELFPAESRLVDTANQYHLWVYADPGFRFPFGFAHRFVLPAPLRMGTLNQSIGIDSAANPRATSVPA